MSNSYRPHTILLVVFILLDILVIGGIFYKGHANFYEVLKNLKWQRKIKMFGDGGQSLLEKKHQNAIKNLTPSLWSERLFFLHTSLQIVSLLLGSSVIGMILSMIDQYKNSITLHQTKSNEIQNYRKIWYFWRNMFFPSIQKVFYLVQFYGNGNISKSNKILFIGIGNKIYHKTT